MAFTEISLEEQQRNIARLEAIEEEGIRKDRETKSALLQDTVGAALNDAASALKNTIVLKKQGQDSDPPDTRYMVVFPGNDTFSRPKEQRQKALRSVERLNKHGAIENVGPITASVRNHFRLQQSGRSSAEVCSMACDDNFGFLLDKLQKRNGLNVPVIPCTDFFEDSTVDMVAKYCKQLSPIKGTAHNRAGHDGETATRYPSGMPLYR